MSVIISKKKIQWLHEQTGIKHVTLSDQGLKREEKTGKKSPGLPRRGEEGRPGK
jgi:hypothetical protein